MIIGRADNKNLPILLAGLVILDFAGKVDLVKVKLECRLQLGTLSVHLIATHRFATWLMPVDSARGSRDVPDCNISKMII